LALLVPQGSEQKRVSMPPAGDPRSTLGSPFELGEYHSCQGVLTVTATPF